MYSWFVPQSVTSVGTHALPLLHPSHSRPLIITHQPSPWRRLESFEILSSSYYKTPTIQLFDSIRLHVTLHSLINKTVLAKKPRLKNESVWANLDFGGNMQHCTSVGSIALCWDENKKPDQPFGLHRYLQDWFYSWWKCLFLAFETTWPGLLRPTHHSGRQECCWVIIFDGIFRLPCLSDFLC